MKHVNRRVLIAAALVLLAVAIALCALLTGGREQPLQEGNLLRNGDFSAATDGMPDYWHAGMWYTSEGTTFLDTERMEDGRIAALVENAAFNDARFEQTVSVRGNATYKLTARVRAEGCDPTRVGANVSFLGVYGTSECLYDTDGEFETLTLYARTGKGQSEATVCLRVGGYGSENVGKAWFSDVSLTQVETVPVGVSVLDIAPREQSGAEETGEQGNVIPGLIAGAALYLALSSAVVHFLLRRGRAEISGSQGVMFLLVLLLCAALLRVLLAGFVPGYDVDMGCFGAWAGRMASVGPRHFYTEGYFCDYPPAYMLVLGAVGALANLLGADLSSMDGQFLLKLVPMACDIAVAALLYAAAKRRGGVRAALGLAALAAFNPAYVITGSCWGQIDSVLALLLIAVLLPACDGRWHLAIPAFAFAVLAKPQAGLLAPLGFAALGKDLFCGRREDRTMALRRALIGLGAGGLLTLGMIWLFSGSQTSPFWLVDKYLETLSSYDYATLSTGNLMFLLGGNWVANTRPVLGPVTYGNIGTVLMIVSFAAGIAVYLRGEGRSRLFTAAALTLQLLFVFGVKMHERYILPALALMLFAWLETGDLRLLICGIAASAVSAVNIGVVLAYDYLVAPNLWLGYAISALQLAFAGANIWAAVSLSLGRAPLALRAVAGEGAAADWMPADEQARTAAEKRLRRKLTQPGAYRLRLRPVDYAVMLSITAVYAAVAFYDLGAVKAPQTGYASSAPGETVTFDLGERRENFRIYYYGGISDTQFSFSVSDDGVDYEQETDAYFDRGECFKWMAVRTPQHDADGLRVTGAVGGMRIYSGRYLRVTFKGAGANLWEIAAVTAEGEPLPVAGVTSAGARTGRGDDPAKLADEQDAVPDVPSYKNSMYFDEIYHARTGYEHAHSLSTYETTHPPLGKVFMSWCIRAMGMTPFAWRFAGALCGVLMIPAIYLLAMTLLCSTGWASLCALLLAADCMHFTQTRIATIDSFPVLFMMLMFLFMARWMKMSFYHQRLRDTFVPLAFSGVFMGLAIASKWIGCYGAVGLALLFFLRFFDLWRQGVYAKAHRDEDAAFERAAQLHTRCCVQTIAACCVFFVLVPVAIYAASYIPYLRYYGDVGLNLRTMERIWDAQVLMFDYHKNLVAEHYFASPWYEWPLIVKPMWYYAADYKGAGMASSILSFGNPAVWWTGLAGILFVLGAWVWRRLMPALGVTLAQEDAYDDALPVIAVGFLSAYLPWVLVSRLTFIYHYFASVPFIIIATAQALRYLGRRRPRMAAAAAVVLGAASVVLFAAFYPLASGMEVPRAWCDAAAWFDGWMWY